MALLTIDELARELGVAAKTIRNRVYAGDIPGVRPVVGGVRIHHLVALAVCAGLRGDQLRHVAVLVQRHTSEVERERAVRAYIGTQDRGAA